MFRGKCDQKNQSGRGRRMSVSTIRGTDGGGGASIPHASAQTVVCRSCDGSIIKRFTRHRRVTFTEMNGENKQ
ncbi:hypothetical protein F2P81_004960 [Scophthalmus maximus]|uniref:Uncharacterized protein n=1 Tax=Scophthalmus maximus TaxID=52904 RepID=A0A6A4TC91_SCOMX|nr:hypothetical protein F2P81_004960 [Scophthalmus maximus]